MKPVQNPVTNTLSYPNSIENMLKEHGHMNVKPYEMSIFIVRGDTPVWDRENKCFVSKEAQVEGEDRKTLDLN
jgi:hypothetical protein